MVWSNLTWYYVSMAWCGTAVAPLITHWSCCSLAVGHWYNTVATGLGRIQSFNKKRTSHIPPLLVSFGISIFLGGVEDLWNIPCYDGIATALKSCLFVFLHNVAPVAPLGHIILFQQCTICIDWCFVIRQQRMQMRTKCTFDFFFSFILSIF